MIFNKHDKLEGHHAPFSPSQCSWLKYDQNKAIEVYNNMAAKELGTKLHAWAKQTIDLGIKQSKSKRTLNMYVNDAIGFGMSTEVVLFYSTRFFGTADAICFRDNVLRIHDLKTGKTPAHIEQLMIYAALFCLEYRYNPKDIGIELRIYQNDEIIGCKPIPEDINAIMNKIIDFDDLLKQCEYEEGFNDA